MSDSSSQSDLREVRNIEQDCIDNFRVCQSTSDKFFIKFRRRSERRLFEVFSKSSVNSDSCSTFLLYPNFVFLGDLDTKLRNISETCLNAYVSKCQRESKEYLNNNYKERPQQIFENQKSTKMLISMFYSAVTPKVTTRQYLHRLTYYLKLPSYVFIVAFIYLERIRSKKPRNIYKFLWITEDNMHRLLITAVFIAARILAPGLKQVTESHFSKAAGTKSSFEVCRLVSAFHKLAGADYTVKKSNFKDMLEKI